MSLGPSWGREPLFKGPAVEGASCGREPEFPCATEQSVLQSGNSRFQKSQKALPHKMCNYSEHPSGITSGLSGLNVLERAAP